MKALCASRLTQFLRRPKVTWKVIFKTEQFWPSQKHRGRDVQEAVSRKPFKVVL